jgi:hypothetical protein
MLHTSFKYLVLILLSVWKFVQIALCNYHDLWMEQIVYLLCSYTQLEDLGIDGKIILCWIF